MLRRGAPASVHPLMGEARHCPPRVVPLTLSVLLDLLCGEPPNRAHPVAWLGGIANATFTPLLRQQPLGQLGCGAAATSAVVGCSGLVGWCIERLLERAPEPWRLLLTACALKPSLSVRSLARSAVAVATALEREELDVARDELQALVSRPTQNLPPDLVAAAAIESVAENLSDSVVAPALYYALWGLGGAYGYRAVNTLDAMIGYHGEYEHLGKAAARLDDVLNLVPARLSAGLLVVAAGLLGKRNADSAWWTMWRDARRTASPNAGWPMSAAAGALQVRLEKAGQYKLGSEFAAPTHRDVRRAVRLYYLAAAVALALWAVVSAGRAAPGQANSRLLLYRSAPRD